MVLLLPGGRAAGHDAVTRRRLTYLRMVPFARSSHRRGRDRGVAAWLLRYRYRGWNAPHLHPVEDARRALDEVRRRHGDVPVVLVGHSMGGRTALRVADDPNVVAVCALAPWIEAGEPTAQLAGRTVLIAHGDQDRRTDPDLSHRYAVRAKAVTDRVARFAVHGDGHAMLRRAPEWTRLVTDFALGGLDVEPVAPDIASALGRPSPRGLDVPLGGGARGGHR